MAIFGELTVLPIYSVISAADDVEPVRFAGTGFLFAPQLLVTCWHCVRSPLPVGQRSAALVVDYTRNGFHVAWLTNVTQDERGHDLATATIMQNPNYQFQLATERALQGVDVSTLGYPFSTIQRAAGTAIPIPEARLFKGYIMRTFDFEYRGFPTAHSYELSFPAPLGLSGAPVIELYTRKVLGVVYGNEDVAIVEHLSQLDQDTGERTPEVQRVVSYGLAYHTSVLGHLSGPATQGKTLAEIVPLAR